MLKISKFGLGIGDRSAARFCPHVRQLPHVGFKVVAKMGGRHLDRLEDCEEPIARHVTTNLLERDLQPLFL